jgi:hypothetical protein
MDMKKRWMIILMAVSMVVFGSTAFAGDGQSTSQNNPAGAVMLANNSQVSFQVDDKALENFGVEQEEMGQEDVLMAYADCNWWCVTYAGLCLPVSPSGPGGSICAQICIECPECEYCKSPQ